MPETKIVRVQVARLIRQTCDVNVEVPAGMTDSQIVARLDEVYDDSGLDSLTWEDDDEWGQEPGTHSLVDSSDQVGIADVTLEDDEPDED